MPDPDPTVKFDYATLTALGGRLSRRADDIVMIGAQEIADDLRLAARMASKFATLRFRVNEIADATLAKPEWDRAAFARDLHDRAYRRGGVTCRDQTRCSLHPEAAPSI